MQLNINDEIAKKLEERVKQSQEFSSVEHYVNYILEEVIKQTSGSAQTAASNDDAYTKDQEQEVKKRLEDLGYLD